LPWSMGNPPNQREKARKVFDELRKIIILQKRKVRYFLDHGSWKFAGKNQKRYIVRSGEERHH